MRNSYLCRYIDAVKCMIPPGERGKRGTRKDPCENLVCSPSEPPVLTEEQEAVMKQILPYVDEGTHRTFLLNGVTSSGKTEIYLRTVQAVMEKGKTFIVLVPEISLTPQTVERFISRFGAGNVAVLHSRTDEGTALGAVAQGEKGSGENPHRRPHGRVCTFDRSGGDYRR